MTECLICKKGKVYGRGLCRSCWRAMRRKIVAGETTEQEAMDLGLMLPYRAHGGRSGQGVVTLALEKARAQAKVNKETLDKRLRSYEREGASIAGIGGTCDNGR